MTVRKTNIVIASILTAAAVGLFLGWKQFWFLTDDAFIAFRYASNSLLGHGYTWNPPPFKPVEGYTSFLWVVIVEYVWRIFGVIPPKSANVISLIFSYLTLLLTAFMVMKMKLSEKLSPFRLIILILILAGILSNRTFLAWTSSGLETAMFNFLMLSWIAIAIFYKKYDSHWRILLTSAAALVYLSRPDGMLIVLGTLAILAASFLASWKQRQINARWFYSLSPILIVPAHLLWRRFTYGEWLPNTYYAKHFGAWPESGLRYFASFVLEYALWFWIGLLIVLTVSYIYKKKQPSSISGWPDIPQKTFNLYMIVLIIALHVGYYTLIIGGDHFEFRVYSYLIPLIFISFTWILNRLTLKPLMALAMFVIFILFSLPVPWTHYSLTHRFFNREQTHVMKVPIQDRFPGPVRWYAKWFDDLQAWLIHHHVCMRHQEHKVFYQYLSFCFPDREEGEKIGPEDYPVIAMGSVGVPGWVLPHVFVIDLYGLNDYVIARYGKMAHEERLMAHDRQPPPGYLGAFLPNIDISDRTVSFWERPRPLTAEMIIQAEKKYIERIKKTKERSKKPPTGG